MSRRLAGRLGRVATKLGVTQSPRLVIVFEAVDAQGQPARDTIEAVEGRPNGVTFVHRGPAQVIVFRERTDGPS